MMRPCDGLQVSITAPWNDWRSALVRLDALSEPHWYQPPGAPRPLLHAYVGCASIGGGHLTHVCEAASAPHRILVCVLKCHNTLAVYDELASRAGGDGMISAPWLAAAHLAPRETAGSWQP
jgi:hypothetical protein